MNIDLPANLPERFRDAVEEHHGRLDLAYNNGDRPLVIGSSKDFVECVAKVALNVLGESFSNNYNLSRLAKLAYKKAGSWPTTQGNSRPVDVLADAVGKIPGALAELRNAQGSGHGQPVCQDIQDHNVDLAFWSSHAWVQWLLGALVPILASFERVEHAIDQIASETFYAGDCRRLLEGLDFTSLAPEQLRATGQAIGRRATRQTFNVRIEASTLLPMLQMNIWKASLPVSSSMKPALSTSTISPLNQH